MKSTFFHIAAIIFVFMCVQSWAITIQEFPISTLDDDEHNPYIDQDTVVWQLFNAWYWDWDIWGADISDPNQVIAFTISDSPGDEVLPKLDNDIVVFQYLFFEAEDWDIMGLDLNHPEWGSFVISSTYDNEVTPMIQGTHVVWQSQANTDESWDIWMANIKDLSNPEYYRLAGSDDDETGPCMTGNMVAWKQHSTQTKSILSMGVNVSDPNNFRAFASPLEIRSDTQATLSGHSMAAIDGSYYGNLYVDNLFDPYFPYQVAHGYKNNPIQQPALSRNLLVWQDKRNGHWDIYAFNLSTKEEYRITSNTSDQIYPTVFADAITGHYIVAWEDNRHGNWDIYGAVLSDLAEPMTGCPEADLNGDCLVDFQDLSIMATQWLQDGTEI